MQKVKTFFHVFSNSLFPQESYYHKILHTKFSFSFTYFISLFLIIHVLFSLLFFRHKFLLSETTLDQIKHNLLYSLNQYPKDLTISIKNGQLSTNYNKPYIFWFSHEKVLLPLVVVDQYGEPHKITQYESLALLTSRHLTFNTQKGIRIYPLPYKNITIDKMMINGIKTALLTTHSFIPFILWGHRILLFIILPLFFLVGTFILLLLISLSLYMLATALCAGSKLSYNKCLQISLHATTFPLLAIYVFIALVPKQVLFKPYLINIGMYHMPGKIFAWFVILTFIFVFLSLYEAHTKSLKHRR